MQRPAVVSNAGSAGMLKTATIPFAGSLRAHLTTGMAMRIGCSVSPIDEAQASVPPWERNRELVRPIQALPVPEPNRAPKRQKIKPVKLSRKARKKLRLERQQARQTIGNPCEICGEIDVFRQVQQFVNGTMHIRVSCAKCGRFIRFQRHKEVARVEI